MRTISLTPRPRPRRCRIKYQPHDGENGTIETILQVRLYQPDAATWMGPPWYTIIVIHGGEFRAGSVGDFDADYVCKDLAMQGYYVISVTYRLAPCGLAPFQQRVDSDGRPPQQTDDVKSAILWAESDSARVKNGKVAVLGGSSGGSHGMFVLLDKNPTPGGGYPSWCLNGADNRPICGVLLSGAYDFSDRTSPDITPKFIDDINNYTKTLCPAYQLRDPVTNVAISPSELVKAESDQSFMPTYLANSKGDSMPYRQILDI